jgi:glycosyltransferase involved in cell wall biosynthesis
MSHLRLHTIRHVHRHEDNTRRSANEHTFATPPGGPGPGRTIPNPDTRAGTLPGSERVAVALLTGGGDRPYAFGIATALTSRGVALDFVGSDDIDTPVLRAIPHLTFLNLKGNQRTDAGIATKAWRIFRYYFRLIRYTAVAKPRIFHILWNNKFVTFDRTVLMMYYRALGKKIVFTAHNVNAGKRDATDWWLNRLTLRIQYRLSHHVFVHTEPMKNELSTQFGISHESISVIPFGINNSVADTNLTAQEAKRRLGIRPTDRTLLFFGHIVPYKGLEFLVSAFQRLAAQSENYRLIIAGRPGTGCDDYFAQIRQSIDSHTSRDRVIQRFEFIPDDDTELYFKAADVVVLPYTEIFQSGVLVLGYSFGLPVIASDVGSLKDDILDGRTGYVCEPRDSVHLSETIERYFSSECFQRLDRSRNDIREFAKARFSWDTVSRKTLAVYEALIGTSPTHTDGHICH